MTSEQITKKASKLSDSSAMWEIALQLSILNEHNAQYAAWAKEALKPRPLVRVHPRRTLRRHKVDAQFVPPKKRAR